MKYTDIGCITSMDVFNTSSRTNYSSITLDGLNETTEEETSFNNPLAFVVCTLSLPGNAFVFAVYVGRVTSSTRLYMFALAVVDAAVCVCGVVLTSAPRRSINGYVAIWTAQASAIFSIALLAFVAIERLLAVRRPHKFNISIRRARLVLAAVAGLALAGAALMAVARARRLFLLNRVVRVCVTFSSVLVMIVCYTWMAALLLGKAKRSRVRVAVFWSGTAQLPPSSGSGNRPVIPSVCATTSDVSPSRGAAGAVTVCNSHAASQATAYKNVSLLLIVTVVFVACWLPKWLFYFGASVPVDVQQLFLLTYGINPFIYGAASRMFRNDARLFCQRTRARLTACCR